MDRFNFFRTLGLCVVIATILALFWYSLALNWRIALWIVAVVALTLSLWIKFKTIGGQKGGIIDTPVNRIKNTLGSLAGIVLSVFICWFVGYLSEIVFGYPADYWEITALKGAPCIILISLLISIGYDNGWWKKLKNCIIWFFLIAFSIGLIWILLNYVFPYLYGLF